MCQILKEVIYVDCLMRVKRKVVSSGVTAKIRERIVSSKLIHSFVSTMKPVSYFGKTCFRIVWVWIREDKAGFFFGMHGDVLAEP